MRSEQLYLTDIVEAADAIARFLDGVDGDTFMGNDLIQSAVLQKLLIIGEAAAHISPEFQARGLRCRSRRILNAAFGQVAYRSFKV